jgi:UPF0755 protein
MKKNRFFIKVSLSLALLIVIVFGFMAYQVYYQPALKINQEQYYYFDKELTVNQLSQELEVNYGLKYPILFNQLAERMNLDRWMKNGRYTLNEKMTLIELIKVFREGKLKTVNLTVNPLSSIDKFAELCGKKLEPDENDFLLTLNDEVLLDSLGFSKATLYALLLPDTYNFHWHTSPKELLIRFKKEYFKFWDSSKLNQCQKLGLSPIQVSTLASIVSKETNKYDEMPMVAGMYINRLRINMPLQADPTVKFALNDPNLKRILNIHLQVESPYNTYKNVGLPPGPICIPSKQSIEAVLNYQMNAYLYMCAKEDFSGYHVFASDYNTHLKNASKYQNALNERNIR